MQTETKQVSFDVKPSEAALIRKIVNRALETAASNDDIDAQPLDRMTLTMDLTACHASGNPLRLAELLAADDFNFAHDIYGITNCINRETGQFNRHFSPRFTVRAEVRS